MIIRMFQYGFRKGKENADYGGDFHSMLLAIQNLIEYLNRNYISDKNLEEEVSIMTKSLYDPEVEKRVLKKRKKKLYKSTLIKYQKSMRIIFDSSILLYNSNKYIIKGNLQ